MRKLGLSVLMFGVLICGQHLTAQKSSNTDSRAYLIDRNGQCRIPTDGASKHRLGSGQANPFPIRLTLNAGDIVFLLSDGAWTPFNLYALQKVVATAALKHFSEVPTSQRKRSVATVLTD